MTPSPCPAGARLLAALALACTAGWAAAQAPSSPTAPPALSTPGASAVGGSAGVSPAAGSPPAAAQRKPAPAPRPESRPSWGELTPQQQQALAPLSGSWARLSEAHKRKWLAVSTSYPTMPPGEQARLHSRMAEWVALTPQQRTQARLNFFETQALPVDDKKAKWEAYQALPAEEKRKLAAAAKPPAPPTAAAVQPVPRQKLATVPRANGNDTRAPRIAVVPEQVHQHLAPVLPPPELSQQP